MNPTIIKLAKQKITDAFEMLILDYLTVGGTSLDSAKDFADELVDVARKSSQQAMLNAFKHLNNRVRNEKIEESIRNPKIQ